MECCVIYINVWSKEMRWAKRFGLFFVTADIIIASDQSHADSQSGGGDTRSGLLWSTGTTMGSQTPSGGSWWSGWSDIRFLDGGISPLTLRVPALFGIRRQMIKTADSHLSRFRLSANDDTSYQVEYWGYRMWLWAGYNPISSDNTLKWSGNGHNLMALWPAHTEADIMTSWHKRWHRWLVSSWLAPSPLLIMAAR